MKNLTSIILFVGLAITLVIVLVDQARLQSDITELRGQVLDWAKLSGRTIDVLIDVGNRAKQLENTRVANLTVTWDPAKLEKRIWDLEVRQSAHQQLVNPPPLESSGYFKATDGKIFFEPIKEELKPFRSLP